MDSEVEKKLVDFEKRISYQESIHKNITANPKAFLHGIVNNGAIILISTGVATILTVLIINQITTK